MVPLCWVQEIKIKVGHTTAIIFRSIHGSQYVTGEIATPSSTTSTSNRSWYRAASTES
jgi:hypothetical protein